MKKIINLFIIVLLIFPIKISAINITPKIECETLNLKKGEKTECNFYLNVSDGKISAISASYSFDSQISMIKVENAENWQGNADGNQIDYYDFRDYTNNVPIAKFTYKVKDDITLNENTNSSLNINVIEVADEYGNANILNSLVEVKFNLIKGVVTTTIPNTTKTTTTKKATTTYKKNTTTENSTTTTEQTTISEVSTTVKGSNTTTNRTTYINVEKNNNKNPIIIGSLLLFLILIIIAIIIIIKEEQKRKQYEE